MNEINEVQILTNVRLSQAQKFILTKLMLPNATPLTSYEQTSDGKNIVANRDVLIKLGMVQVGQNEAQITEKGQSALQNEALIDDTGNLTQEGEQYAYAEKLEDVETLADQGQRPEEPNTGQDLTQARPDGPSPVAGIATQSDAEAKPSFESWEMISDIQEALTRKQFIENHSKKS